MYHVLAALLCLSFCISSLWAQKRLPVLNDIYRIQDVAEPDSSPDGKWVVFSVHQLHPDTNQASTNIWCVSVKNQSRRQLTFSNDSTNSLPKWSPDGQWIAYLSNAAGENTQIWLYSFKDSKGIQLTHTNTSISDFSWSSDSNEIVFVAQPKTDSDKPIIINRYQFKDDEEGYLSNARNHLYIVNIKLQKTRMITFGEHDEYSPAWSPDGKYIAYISKRGKDADRKANYEVFLMEPALAPAERQLTHYQGADIGVSLETNLSWSPDGSKIAYLGSRKGKWSYYENTQLAVVHVNNGKVHSISTIDKWLYKPKWAANGKEIYALVEESRNTYLHKINTQTGAMKRLTDGLRFDQDFTIAKNHLVLLSTDDTHPSELFVLDSKPRPLTMQNKELMNEVQFQAAEDFEFKSSDGIDIHGIFIKPARLVKNKKPPSILYLHGGPVDQSSHQFDFDLQWFAANGYAVIAPNPRGSSGRGIDFAKAIYADWGNLDVKDVLGSVDYFVAQGLVDNNRLAVGGWSYGGMLTNYVIASDSRFRAALSGAGSANILSNYGADQYTYEYEQELGMPWAKPNVYLKLSYPFMKSNKIKTPTLFMCGQLDFNVPCEGSEQLYQALKSLNTPTELVIYPKEHHVLDVPVYIADRLQRYVDWLDLYMK